MISKRMRAAVKLLGASAVVRRLRAPALVFACALLLQIFAALSPSLVERIYSRRIFPALAGALSAASGPFPFSVAELSLACAVVVVVVLLCALVFRAVRQSNSLTARRRVVQLLSDLCVGAAWVASVAALAFMLVFGLNYERQPLARSLGYEQRRATADELAPMVAEIVDGINRNYEEAHATGASAPDDAGIARVLEESYSRLAASTDGVVPAGGFGPPKPVAVSGAMTRAGISGIYFPLTGEANYNRLMPDFQHPFAMAHEMAHQRGFARESEADFIAYLVCTQSSHPFVRYSGYRSGLVLLTELWRVAPDRARELSKNLCAGYRTDTSKIYLFWWRGHSRITALSRSINDIYLKANRVRSGVGNYSESSALLIGYYLKRGARAADPVTQLTKPSALER